MTNAILLPMIALAAWTGIVLLLVPIARFRAAFRREVTASDFKFGESDAVPGAVSLPNRNFMNLLEMPVLFYVCCLLLYVTQGGSLLAQQLAWTYVILRVVHSLIHLSYNNVIHRMVIFIASNVALVSLWFVAAAHIM